MVSFQEVLKVAAALSKSGKSGGMKTDLYFHKANCFLLSSSGSLLLRFEEVRPFPGEVKFNILDWEGDVITMYKGQTRFVTKGAYNRVKLCAAPKLEYMDILRSTKALFKTVAHSDVRITDQILTQIDEGLSHVEFSGVEGVLRLKQRDIYSGNIIEVTPGQESSGFFRTAVDPFSPVALKTSDFISMFMVEDSVTFGFSANVTMVQTRYCKGLLANCKYDGLVEITTVEGVSDGGQKPKDKQDKQGAHRQVGAGKGAKDGQGEKGLREKGRRKWRRK